MDPDRGTPASLSELSKRRALPGARPGTLIPDSKAGSPKIHVIAFDEHRLEEKDVDDLDSIPDLTGRFPVIWINVDGLGDTQVIRHVGETFKIHRLALEDIVNVHQRPKAEEYEDHVFIVTRMVLPGRRAATEQVSIFVGDGFVLSFQERPGDCFDMVRERLRRHSGRIRESGNDYLAYALIDSVVDAYFPVLEAYGEKLETLENAVISRPRPNHIEQLHAMKRDLLSLRRAIWPHREMLNTLIRDKTPFVTDQTRIYLRDCYDHTIQLMDIVETYREIASGLVDLYLSSMSTRLNDIMKVLTVIATIFIPLNFIASLYGMNFDRAISPWNMPELGWRFGYPFALTVMAVAAAAMVLYFLRRRWIGPFWPRPGSRRKNAKSRSLK